jgi:hypothetical protein
LAEVDISAAVDGRFRCGVAGVDAKSSFHSLSLSSKPKLARCARCNHPSHSASLYYSVKWSLEDEPVARSDPAMPSRNLTSRPLGSARRLGAR